MRSRLLALALFLLPGTALIAFGQEKKGNVVDCKYFSISVPPGFKLDTKTPIEDFDIITVLKGEQVCVGIYVGNYPDYPLYIKREGKKEIEESKLGNIETISEWKGDELLRKEMKVRLSNEKWPQYLHIFYGDVDKDTVMISERIVSSLKLKKGMDQKVHKK